LVGLLRETDRRARKETQMSETSTTTQPATDAQPVIDERVLVARLDWLESAGDDDEARAIENALLSESDNGPHAGEPDDGDPGDSEPDDGDPDDGDPGEEPA
jgi:hypothetical protein